MFLSVYTERLNGEYIKLSVNSGGEGLGMVLRVFLFCFLFGFFLAIGVENLQICWKYEQREVMSDFDSPVFYLKQSANTVKAYHTTSWIGLPRAQTLTLLKQCLIILMENQKKAEL